jgi:hypothetical protein
MPLECAGVSGTRTSMAVRAALLLESCIMHQENFSNTPVALGQQIYRSENGPDPDDNPVDCHLVLTHTHLMQTGFTPDNRREIISLGCLRNPRKTKYKQYSKNRHFEWNQGFLMIKGGYFYPLSRKGTNWLAHLGEHGKNAEIVGVA